MNEEQVKKIVLILSQDIIVLSDSIKLAIHKLCIDNTDMEPSQRLDFDLKELDAEQINFLMYNIDRLRQAKFGME